MVDLLSEDVMFELMGAFLTESLNPLRVKPFGATRPTRLKPVMPRNPSRVKPVVSLNPSHVKPCL